MVACMSKKLRKLRSIKTLHGKKNTRVKIVPIIITALTKTPKALSKGLKDVVGLQENAILYSAKFPKKAS